jgi:hypothetical protein
VKKPCQNCPFRPRTFTPLAPDDVGKMLDDELCSMIKSSREQCSLFTYLASEEPELHTRILSKDHQEARTEAVQPTSLREESTLETSKSAALLRPPSEIPLQDFARRTREAPQTTARQVCNLSSQAEARRRSLSQTRLRSWAALLFLQHGAGRISGFDRRASFCNQVPAAVEAEAQLIQNVECKGAVLFKAGDQSGAVFKNEAALCRAHARTHRKPEFSWRDTEGEDDK